MILDARGKAARNEYLREWRKKNKDKVKKYNDEYWQRKAEKEKREGDV